MDRKAITEANRLKRLERDAKAKAKAARKIKARGCARANARRYLPLESGPARRKRKEYIEPPAWVTALRQARGQVRPSV